MISDEPNAPETTPLLSSASSRTDALVGLQPITPGTAELEEIAPYVVLPAESTVDVPRDGTRKVHVGANAVVNFVKADSITFPVFT